MKKAYLVLADGSVYEGSAFGAEKPQIGELVFNTGVVGYLETITDPSYAGQIVLQTFPMIGNYGVIPEDFEGTPALRGYVVREHCDAPSNFRCEGDLDSFLKEQGIPGLCGVDTRAITRKIRECGVMNAAICYSLPADIDAIRNYRVTGAVQAVCCKSPAQYPAPGEEKHRVALIDYGAKRNIVRELQKRGCAVTVFPADVCATELLAGDYDGVMLSNGPGDPSENSACIAEIRKLLGKLPLFGICLGHQLVALAAGGRTEKMKFGHRGGNQPVKEVGGTRTYITSQNHGYAVVSDSLKQGRISFINVNDLSCEGVDYPEWNAFTVQFHPEGCAGPHSTSFLFDRFISMMENKNTEDKTTMGGEKTCR